MATESVVNIEFVRSVPGILRISEFVVSICAIISIESGYWCHYTGLFGFYQTVAIAAMVLVFIFIVLYLFRFDQTIGAYINLPVTFLLNDCILTLFYFIATIIAFVLVGNCSNYVWGHGGRIAASIFGILATGLFAVSSFLDYKSVKGRTPDGGTTTTVSQPKTVSEP